MRGSKSEDDGDKKQLAGAGCGGGRRRPVSKVEDVH